MRSAILTFFLLAFDTLARADDEERFVLDSKESKRVSAVLNYTSRHPQLKAETWSVIAPIAPELARQTKVKTTYSPDLKPTKEKGAEGRNVAFALIPAAKGDARNELKVKVTFEATLFERHLRPLGTDEKAPPAEELPAAEKKKYLAEFGEMDFDTAGFQTWLDDKKLRKQKDETDLAFAKRAFIYLKTNGKYDYKEEMDRNASKVYKSLESDCGGLSFLYVAVLRANGVPSRSLIGRWAESAKTEKLKGLAYYQTHVKAEFYANGIGWIPVDVASGIIQDRKSDGLRFFGHDPGDFLVFHIDPHVEVDTKLFGVKTFIGLQIPAFWVRGGGDYTPQTETQTWEVKVLK